VQFNDGGAFGGDSGLLFNKTTNKLTAGGDVELNDGGTFTTTVQTVTPTANRTISFPNATGTIGLVAGSSGQLLYNASGANAGLSTVTTDGTNVTLTGRFISSLNGAASAPPGTFTGTWFTGGTATTTKPQVLIEPTGATSTAWSTAGTGLGVNAASGFAGNLLDLQVNGSSRFKFDVANKRFNLFTDGTRGDAYFDRGGPAGDTRIVSSAATNGRFIFTDYSEVFTATRFVSPIFATQQNASSDASNLPVAILSTAQLFLTSLSGQVNPTIIGGNRTSVDENPVNFSVLAKNRPAGTSGWTNTRGSHLIFAGGDAASAATNQADGGNVNLDGGQAYGTGTDGNIIIGATRGNLQITDARNVVLGTTTGTKIGTATTQKLGFYNATPVVQPTAVADITTTATAGTLPTPDGTVTIADATTPTVTELLEYCVELESKLEAALGHLRTLGLIAT
jgi:hypothetical protein